MPSRDDDVDEASRESFPASDPPAFTVTTASRVAAAHAYAAHAALDPFFEVVQRGLAGLVDGEHFFDTIAEHAVFEFRYDIGS